MKTLRLLCAALIAVLPCTLPARAQNGPSSLLLVAANGQSSSLSAAQLLALPQTTVRVPVPHGNREALYQGVALPLLLGRMHAPLGDKLRGPALAMYVMAEGADHYRALYALAELDPSFHPGTVIVADRRDGQPLDARTGPFMMVNTADRRPARWVRNLASLRLVQVPASSAGQQLEAQLPAPQPSAP